MGILRLFLAVAVIKAHTGYFFGINIIPGSMAVELFFMISGFYMSMVINGKYNVKRGYFAFITNRALKIYPAYFLVVLFSMAVSFFCYFFLNYSLPLTSVFEGSYKELSILSSFFVILTNAIIIGQDAVMFMYANLSDGSLHFTSNFRLHESAMYKFMLVPQAWSISMELMFYLIAPFLVKRKASIIIAIALLSMLVKFIIVRHLELNNDPWTYRFFPSEIQYFMLGVISCKIYPFVLEMKKSLSKFLFIIFVFSFSIGIYCVNHTQMPNDIKDLIVFFFAFIGMPFVFFKTKDSKVDRYIGELSYPMYLSHFLVISSSYKIITDYGLDKFQFLIVLFITALLSIVINKIIIMPIEKIRIKRLSLIS